MTKLRSTPYSNCTKNVLNDGGADGSRIDTFGNLLCGRLAKYYGNNPPLDEINKKGIRVRFCLKNGIKVIKIEFGIVDWILSFSMWK